MIEGDQTQAPEAPDAEPSDESWTACQWLTFLLTRTLLVALIYCISITIPNINILLTLGGAVTGTVLNILIPVLYYNRAYSTALPKHQRLQKKQDAQNEDEQMLMGDEPQPT